MTEEGNPQTPANAVDLLRSQVDLLRSQGESGKGPAGYHKRRPVSR